MAASRHPRPEFRPRPALVAAIAVGLAALPPEGARAETGEPPEGPTWAWQFEPAFAATDVGGLPRLGCVNATLHVGACGPMDALRPADLVFAAVWRRVRSASRDAARGTGRTGPWPPGHRVAAEALPDTLADWPLARAKSAAAVSEEGARWRVSVGRNRVMVRWEARF